MSSSSQLSKQQGEEIQNKSGEFVTIDAFGGSTNIYQFCDKNLVKYKLRE